MSNVVFIFLCITTVVYLCLCFTTDLRDRTIYSFPCLPLAAAFWVSALGITNHSPYMCGILIFHVAVFLIFKVKPIWADGDNDLFFLSSAVFANAFFLGVRNIPAYMATELIFLSVSLGLSMVIAFIEARIKKRKLEKTSGVALAPGFCITCMFLFWSIAKMRWFICTI